ncbi:MAG: AI-2E family transporter, partial [Gallionellaceae bacterium]|nr:AI-2E family transporter [Gallionellaceae bacterium]
MSTEQPDQAVDAITGETPELRAAVENATAIPIRGVRNVRMNVSLGVLAVIACVASLYLARAFFVPLLIGILASYTLSPVVAWLKACHIPRPLGAALVLCVLVGGLSWIAFSLSDDATAMIEKLPEATRKLRQHLIDTRTGPTTLQNMQEAAKQLEGATNDAGNQQEVLIKSARKQEVRVTTVQV